MKHLNQSLKQSILLTLLTCIIVIEPTLAANVGVGGSGSLGFDCDVENKYCTCTGGKGSMDCKAMMRNCALESAAFKCFDITRDTNGNIIKSRPNDNGDDCECLMAKMENTTTRPIIHPDTQVVAPPDQVVHDHRSPKIDSNSNEQAEIIAPNNRTGTVRVQRTRPSSSPTENTPGPIVSDHR